MKKTDSERNVCIDFMRFLFCFLIVNYHLFSHYLRYIDAPNCFIRGYMGDEFFFIIAGYYFALAAVKDSTDSSVRWSIAQFIKRIKKIAIPYYISWILCFIGRRYVYYWKAETRSIFLDLFNSVYELLFLEMFGFKKGLYSNDVAWFFSALLIITFALGPIVHKYKQNFTLYIAPLISLFCYGILSLSFDYLHDPYMLIPESYVMKGIIRACAAICLGMFLCGLVQSDYLLKIRIKRGISKTFIVLADLFLWLIIIIYMIYPFHSNADVLMVQYDYIIVLLMVLALIPIFHTEFFNGEMDTIYKGSNYLGKYSFYAFMGQAVFYSVDPIVFSNERSVFQNALILNVAVSLISIGLWIIHNLLISIYKNSSAKKA